MSPILHLSPLGVWPFQLKVYVRILCVYQHICVVVYTPVHANMRVWRIKRKRVHGFRGKGEIGAFPAIIVRTHPPLGMKRSLIKTESGRGEMVY